MLRVYLSGPIEYAEDHGRGWRLQAKEHFKGNPNVHLVDPCDSSLHLLQEHGIESIEQYNKLKHGDPEDQALFHEATRSLIQHDIAEVRKADLVFAKISHVASGGTSGELTLAEFLGIPILAFCTSDLAEVSGWVQSLPTILYSGADDAFDLAINALKVFAASDKVVFTREAN